MNTMKSKRGGRGNRGIRDFTGPDTIIGETWAWHQWYRKIQSVPSSKHNYELLRDILTYERKMHMLTFTKNRLTRQAAVVNVNLVKKYLMEVPATLSENNGLDGDGDGNGRGDGNDNIASSSSSSSNHPLNVKSISSLVNVKSAKEVQDLLDRTYTVAPPLEAENNAKATSTVIEVGLQSQLGSQSMSLDLITQLIVKNGKKDTR